MAEAPDLFAASPPLEDAYGMSMRMACPARVTGARRAEFSPAPVGRGGAVGERAAHCVVYCCCCVDRWCYDVALVIPIPISCVR
eukprot:6241678-Pyramimonas_sp.AAC.1